MNSGVSVVICCYNSALRLPETLAHLSRQQVSEDISWEIVVVNNASTDNTVAVAEDSWKKFGQQDVPLRIVHEPASGLTNARNRGVREARYEYIVFCDDDNWLVENYVELSYRILSNDEKIGAAGGKSVPVGEVELPDWFENFKAGYTVGPQGDKSGDISERRFIWGTGMVTRRSLYLYINTAFPSFLIDRRGNELSAGGDTEYTIRLIFSGYGLYYDERLVVEHFIPAFRLTEAYRDRLYQGFRGTDHVLEPYFRQAAVALLSPFKKLYLLSKEVTRYTITRIKPVAGWSRKKEATEIFMKTGIQLEKMDDMYIKVRHIYTGLRKPFKIKKVVV